ncbi:hypothetical protein KBK19_06215 [Microvirga sp. STR05]|uniref:Uncharacterized protein n=1 Tax=Hymenobacter duratus TaxID=2771356 RepID=A0ABR8JCX9_9BACT|nr:hypothetical protein [Hymenobacter duratus]MBD2714623.1 hypothetical protein [Hymenobacter duratus]MBR7949527.1 hypothetical protein [Microvirga sp. STR05]
MRRSLCPGPPRSAPYDADRPVHPLAGEWIPDSGTYTVQVAGQEKSGNAGSLCCYFLATRSA